MQESVKAVGLILVAALVGVASEALDLDADAVEEVDEILALASGLGLGDLDEGGLAKERGEG